MRTVLVTTIVLVMLCLAAHADIFNMSPGLTSLELVTIGDPGNTGELSGWDVGGHGETRLCGSVGYTYQMSKFETTAAQYCDFLNHKAQSDPYGLYSTFMAGFDTTECLIGCGIQRGGSDGGYTYSVADDWVNRPVNEVSFWDACRFVNWLNNGQGDGDTETGAYTLNGDCVYGDPPIQRNPGARYYLPSEDEWYKAAYYKGGATDAGYWDFPTQSDAQPGNQLLTPDPGNSMNYRTNGVLAIGYPYWLTEVGRFSNSASAYGTFDQGGDVGEWIESIQADDYNYRGIRGGAFYRGADFVYAAGRSCGDYPAQGSAGTGFRIVAVPEPSSILALLAGLGSVGGLAVRRRRV